MLRALPTSIRLPNGQGQSVLWGLPEKAQQHETIMVGHALQHFRAVDVSVVGVRITEETPYRATLSAVFPDGSRRQRKIEGVVQRIYLDNIRPEYSRVYHIKEASAAAAQSSTTATTPSTSPRPMLQEDFDYPTPRDNDLRDKGRKDKAMSSSEHQLLMASSSSATTKTTTVAASMMIMSLFICIRAFNL